MPNTRRRRRRDETVLSRRVGVGGVYWALLLARYVRNDCIALLLRDLQSPTQVGPTKVRCLPCLTSVRSREELVFVLLFFCLKSPVLTRDY